MYALHFLRLIETYPVNTRNKWRPKEKEGDKNFRHFQIARAHTRMQTYKIKFISRKSTFKILPTL